MMFKIKRKTVRKIGIATIALLLLSIMTFPIGEGTFDLSSIVFAADTYTIDVANTDGTYSTQSTGLSFSTAYYTFSHSSGTNLVIRNTSGKVIAMKQGMAITKSSDSVLKFTSSISTYTSGSKRYAYVSNNYVAYYNETSSDGTSVTITISGYTGECDIDDVILVPSAFVYDPTQSFGGTTDDTWEFDYYTKNSSGCLVHYISTYNSNGYTSFSSITIDDAPSFMTTNVRYYSTDGLYYYTNPYDAAEGDTSASSYVGMHAIYYELLSYRTQTTYTATELNSYIALKASDSVYAGDANLFIEYGTKYGVNAAMELAFANHESDYGTSSYALNRYNLFGINAGDADPSNASYYESVADCLEIHTRSILNRSYFDAYSYINTSLPGSFYDVSDDDRASTYYTTDDDYAGDSKYFGTCPGNKSIGINVVYASDPFHGEKVAAHMYQMDVQLGSDDYDRYSIGITNTETYAYSEADTSSNVLYKYASRSTDHESDYPVGMSVTILGETGDFYIVASEMPLAEYSDGTVYACNVWDYDYDVSVAYVLKSSITLVRDNLDSSGSDAEFTLTSSTYTINKSTETISKIKSGTSVSTFVNGFSNGSVAVYSGSSQVTSGNMKTGMTVKIYNSDGNYVDTYSIVVTGDVNGDGSISISDLVQINRYLLGKTTLSGAYKKAADTNASSSVTISDLVQINRYLLGKTTITPN